MTMKHFYTTFMWLALTAEAFAASLTYDFHDDLTCTLMRADASGDVVLPAVVSRDGVDYTLTTIGAEAFMDSRVTSVSLPATITAAGEDAFRRCDYMTRVVVPSVEAWLGITFANEYASPLAGYHPLYIGDEPLTRLTVPAGEAVLKPYAFFNCSSLQTADLSGVTSIGEHCFDGCENLSSVVLAPGLQYVGDWAFNICRELTSIDLPAGVTYLGQGTFYGCSELSSIKLPDDIQVIPALCFAGCLSIGTLDFVPASVIGVGDYAFYFCTGLQTAHFSESVRMYGDFVFYDCESLRSVSMPCAGASLGEFMFADCYSLTSVELPAGIKSIPRGLFFECNSLESVELPPTLELIDEYAFGDCHSLKYIAFPQGLRQIGDRAFYGCWTVRRLEFPASMESIGAETFYLCYAIEQIHVRSVTPFNISFFSFDWQADRQAQVFVPAASLELYRSDTYGWANFDNLVGLEEYNPDTVLSISWGDAAVSRPVAYGTRLTLTVARIDGSRPARVTFNGQSLDVAADNTVTTPVITAASSLVIE